MTDSGVAFNQIVKVYKKFTLTDQHMHKMLISFEKPHNAHR